MAAAGPPIIPGGPGSEGRQHAGPVIVRGGAGARYQIAAPMIIRGEDGALYTAFSEDIADIEPVEEEPQECIAPSPDVFSYFLLTEPSEQKKHGRFTTDALTSYILVCLVLAIQSVLLFCVWNKVIVENVDWRAGIMNTGKDWNIAGIGPTPGNCNKLESMCMWQNGTFTCAPPSVQLISRWDELDTNQDGVWTRQEVLDAREHLQCQYGVDPVEVFDVVGGLLKNREHQSYIWVDDAVHSGQAISRDYFTYIMGDVAMCGYRNGDMCGNLMQRGFFDAAIMHEIPRVGKTTRSALKYCHMLLDEGGLCQTYLPSAYATWRIESAQECHGPEYSKFVYSDPNTGKTKSLLAVDYEARKDYEVAQTHIFKVYKCFILFIWLLIVVQHIRDVGNTFLWIKSIPIDKENAESDCETPSAREFRIGQLDSARRRSLLRDEDVHKITWRHRAALYVVTSLRIFLIIILLTVGLTFLAKQNDYIGLLLDGVAMMFIVEVEEILYSKVIRQDVRQAWEERAPMPFTNTGLLAGRPDITDLVWFFFLLSCAVVFVQYHTWTLVEPLYDALQCACLSQGESCHEAKSFSYEFWQQYWMLDLPAAIMRINQNAGYHAASLVQSAHHHVDHVVGNVLPHVSHVGNVLKHHHLRP